MPSGIPTLVVTAASLGFVHTLFGPDHYLPFVMISQARKWSRLRTAMVTFLWCGLGKLPTAHLERYSHALAGLIIFTCGASIQFLGL